MFVIGMSDESLKESTWEATKKQGRVGSGRGDQAAIVTYQRSRRFFLNFFTYLLTILLVSVVSFRFGRFGGFQWFNAE